MTDFLLVVLASYILGSFPTALIAGRIIGKIDLREHGSGNAGATNVYRLFGLKPYIVVLLIDILKGYAAVSMIAPFGAGFISGQMTALYCGVAAVLGHIWTVFARFKGGKGVATACGMFLGLAPVAALGAFFVYLLVTLTTQYVALGSILGAISAAVILLTQKMMFGKEVPAELILISIAMAGLIMFSHRENIKRLLNGEERKTDFLKKFKRSE